MMKPSPAPWTRPYRAPNPRARNKVNETLGVTLHRWPQMPSAELLGITHRQRHALVRVRLLYGEVLDSLSYMTVHECAKKLDEAEALIKSAFPGDWETVWARLFGVTAITGEAATVADEVAEVFEESQCA